MSTWYGKKKVGKRKKRDEKKKKGRRGLFVNRKSELEKFPIQPSSTFETSEQHFDAWGKSFVVWCRLLRTHVYTWLLCYAAKKSLPKRSPPPILGPCLPKSVNVTFSKKR